MLAPAKINLSLNIIGRDDNNYHLLHGIAIFANFGSHIDIRLQQNNGFQIDYSGDFADDIKHIAPHDNIITHAVHLFCHTYHCPIDMQVYLEKNIPIGAGLGGGSSEAATILLLLNNYYNINVSLDELTILAKKLGADVPMCLYRQPLYYSGIGDKITLLPHIDIKQKILLVKPQQSLSTASVFKYFAQHNDIYDDINAKIFNDKDNLNDHIRQFGNDLAPSAISLCPDIAHILDDLAHNKAINMYGMSGSGSTCYALYDINQQQNINDLVLRFKDMNYWVTICNFHT